MNPNVAHSHLAMAFKISEAKTWIWKQIHDGPYYLHTITNIQKFLFETL